MDSKACYFLHMAAVGWLLGMSRRVLIGIICLGHVGVAVAQEKPEYLLKKDQTNKREGDPACPCAAAADTKPDAPPKPPKPWTFKTRVGSVFQLSQSRGVLGRIDGTTRSFHVDVHAEANWRCQKQEVRNRLDATDVIVKTQNTGRWVPAADFVELESIYQYRATPTWGPFARAGLRTSLFLGRDLRTNAVQYQLPDGTLTESRTEYRLSDRFLPLTLLQSVGAFYNPVHNEHFDIDVRGGLGVREVVADGQLGLLDVAATPSIVELTDLHTYHEAGLELISMIRGEVWDERFSYYAGGEFLLPVIRSAQADDERASWDLVSKTVRVGFAYRLAKSASIIYELRVVHQPQLIDTVQVLNNAGFKATFNLL